MRYSKDSDWVELDGCGDLPMRKLDGLYTAGTLEAFAIAASVVRDWCMTAEAQPVTVGDVFGLTLKQWDWLRKSIFEAARAEVLDPEV